MNKLVRLLRQNSTLSFLLVGASAAALHQLVVVLLVQAQLLPPLSANMLAFVCAWLLSYFGHYYLTFAAKNGHRQAAPRFLLTSLLGFGLNQAMYAALLRFTSLHYALALFIVLLAVAVITYLLGKFWAFAKQ